MNKKVGGLCFVRIQSSLLIATHKIAIDGSGHLKLVYLSLVMNKCLINVQ